MNESFDIFSKNPTHDITNYISNKYIYICVCVCVCACVCVFTHISLYIYIYIYIVEGNEHDNMNSDLEQDRLFFPFTLMPLRNAWIYLLPSVIGKYQGRRDTLTSVWQPISEKQYWTHVWMWLETTRDSICEYKSRAGLTYIRWMSFKRIYIYIYIYIVIYDHAKALFKQISVSTDIRL